MNVGFIGLGHMGSGMAENLVRAGHETIVFNRSADKRRPLVELGATEAASVADACNADVVMTMLADDAALRAVALGDNGIVGKLRRGAIHISMSTVSVELVRELADAHAQAGQKFVAAPVFGRPDMAAAGKLFIVASGDEDAITTCTALFDAMGQKTFRLGTDPAAASLVKLCGNFTIASAIETLGEALALVRKAGVDPGMFLDVLTSSLFPAPAYRTYGTLIAEGKFRPAGFAARLGYKDVRLLLAASRSLQVPMPVASLIHDRFVRLLAHGEEQVDWSAIGRLAAEDAGVARAASP